MTASSLGLYTLYRIKSMVLTLHQDYGRLILAVFTSSLGITTFTLPVTAVIQNILSPANTAV